MTERQLDLLRSKRQKGTLPPPPLEVQTHIAVADTLRFSLSKGWWWTHIGHGELRSEETGALLKRMGLKPGIADFMFIDPQGRIYFLEMKRKGGKVSAAQSEFISDMVTRSIPCQIAWSYEEAMNILKAWGAVRVTT